MKVYFSSSLRAKKLYKDNFKKIYQTIKDLEHKHTSDFVLKADPENFYSRTGNEFEKFYNRLTSQIKKADVCVFETSLHSLGIGYCVNLALDMGKPVIILHLEGEKPALFYGIKDDRLQICKYSKDNIKKVLKTALEVAKGMMDIRFTFFITPKITRFLDWVSKEKKTPRAVYLRNLINEAMKKEDFK